MKTVAGNDIQHAAELLRGGEIVAVPTETVYGLAANALDALAVAKIFAAKNRPHFNPLIVHLADWSHAEKYADTVSPCAAKLAAAAMPGPLSLLLPRKSVIPDIVTAGSDLVALRVPAHPMMRSLLQAIDFPLAAPSANPFGYVSPTDAAHVMNSMEGKIPYILDGGRSAVGLESTIVGFDDNDNPVLYREGGFPREAIEQITGKKLSAAPETAKPASSGRLKSHYATHAQLITGDVAAMLPQYKGKKVAALLFSNPIEGLDEVHQYILSPNGNLNEAAAALFAVMQQLDKQAYDVILAEIFPNEGLGYAINDRLHRANHVFKNSDDLMS